MLDIDTLDEIDNLKSLINEVIDLSIVNEDSIINRNRSGLDNKHVLSLVNLITQKLQILQNRFNLLIGRFK